VNSHHNRLTRAQVQDLFQGGNRSNYLNFSPSEAIIQSVAIKARSNAVEKGLNSSNLSDIAGSHGSPPFSIILGTWELLKSRGLIPKIQGIGIEVGSGLALLSCAVKTQDIENLITGLIALEATKPFVTSGIGITSREILGKDASSILPCFGVFEEIPLEDNSIDFGIQIESLHHANTLSDAIKEISRIICPGGYFVSIDRSWVDTVTQATLESMLNHQYSREWLKGKNFDQNLEFTRRDNGEHEYRDCEWLDAFESNGFKVISLSFLHPKIELWHVVKRIISIFHLNRFFSIQVKSRPGILRTYLAQTVGFKKFSFSNLLVSPHPRPLTVMVLRKNGVQI
jgi:SAM-dependent methyltransferase